MAQYHDGRFTSDYTVGNYNSGKKFLANHAEEGKLVRAITVWYGGERLNH